MGTWMPGALNMVKLLGKVGNAVMGLFPHSRNVIVFGKGGRVLKRLLPTLIWFKFGGKYAIVSIWFKPIYKLPTLAGSGGRAVGSMRLAVPEG